MTVTSPRPASRSAATKRDASPTITIEASSGRMWACAAARICSAVTAAMAGRYRSSSSSGSPLTTRPVMDAGHLCRRLEAEREDAHEVVAGDGQLRDLHGAPPGCAPARPGCPPMAGTVTSVWTAQRTVNGPGVTAHVEGRVDAVGVALRLAQQLVEAGVEQAADDRVEHAQTRGSRAWSGPRPGGRCAAPSGASRAGRRPRSAGRRAGPRTGRPAPGARRRVPATERRRSPHPARRARRGRPAITSVAPSGRISAAWRPTIASRSTTAGWSRSVPAIGRR